MQKSSRDRTTTALQDFPAHLRTELEQTADGSGTICAGVVHHICEEMDLTIEALMLRLVPLAATYGVAPISDYSVGAVARGQRQGAKGYSALYLGANMEFPQRALCFSLHAEQAAVANAWNSREPGLTSVAVSAPPCGHCRQFLYELSGSSSLRIVFPDDSRRNYRETDIIELLPGAFGPADLGQKGNMMAVNTAPVSLRLATDSNDEVVRKALEAARFSYAPYTSNHSGCALQLQDGSIFSGSYAENAAHNPGLSPLHAALSNMRMALGPGGTSTTWHKPHKIVRCVLVESATDISQRELVSTLLSSLVSNIAVPDVEFEYYPVQVATA